MPLITSKDQIRELRKESRRTGKHIRRIVDKKQLLKENPELAADPRMALTKDNFVLDIRSMEQLTVEEVRDLCDKCGNDLFAADQYKAVKGLDLLQVICIPTNSLNKLMSAAGVSVEKKPISTPPVFDNTELDPSADNTVEEEIDITIFSGDLLEEDNGKED